MCISTKSALARIPRWTVKRRKTEEATDAEKHSTNPLYLQEDSSRVALLAVVRSGLVLSQVFIDFSSFVFIIESL